MFAPQATSLTVKTVNGGVTVSDIRGSLRFEATNGGGNLTRLAGDIAGSTVNGGINLEFRGRFFGSSLEPRTTGWTHPRAWRAAVEIASPACRVTLTRRPYLGSLEEMQLGALPAK